MPERDDVDRPTPRYQQIADLFRTLARSKGDELLPRPATPDELAAAEQALGSRFPDSYRWFQLEFGDIAQGPVDIYSVRTAEAAERNIVGINLEERHDAYPRLPARLIAFSDSGGGDLLCFDSSTRQDGECPVVWWDHEGDEEQRPEPAASSFLDWLEGELREWAAEPGGSHLGILPRAVDPAPAGSSTVLEEPACGRALIQGNRRRTCASSLFQSSFPSMA